MATRVHTIVVGVALVDELDPVLPSAIRLAQSTGARLHVVHVLKTPDPIAEGRGAGYLSRGSDYLDARTRVIRDAIRAHCEYVAGGEMGGTEIHTLTGSPHRCLAAFAAERRADLLIIGATRHGRIWRNILGTTAERVLRKTTVPVLVLHQPFFREVEKVLLTTDLTSFSAKVHDRALELVEGLFGDGKRSCRCLLVLEYQLPPPAPEGVESVETIGKRELMRFLREQPSRRDLVAARVRVGEPAVEINVEADAWGADLIVLGTHGRNGLARFVFGSVAAATLRDATRNALVVPTPARLRFDDALQTGIACQRGGTPRPPANGTPESYPVHGRQGLRRGGGGT